MPKRKSPTPEDRDDAIRISLSGIATNADFGDVKVRLSSLHPKDNSFPAEVFLELAAEAIEESGVSREHPLEFEKIRERLLPECTAHTRAQHYKSILALRAAAMIRAGVDPGLFDEISWWEGDDAWEWAFDALAVYLRAASERTREPVAVVCERVAARNGITLESPD